MRSGTTNCSLTVEFALINENILIQNEKITQLYVIQSEQDPLEWSGVLFVDSGIYMGATVRFKILIDDSYPNCGCPKVFFDPVPFHPLIEPHTGELDTKNALPDWISTTHKLYQLLLFVKRVIRDAALYIDQIRTLINHLQLRPDESDNETYSNDRYRHITDHNLDKLNDVLVWPTHTLNFLDIYENNQDEFKLRVENFKSQCCQQLYEHTNFMGNDRNTLAFTDWNPNIHEKVRECILAGKFTPPSLFAAYHKETESVSFIPGDAD